MRDQFSFMHFSSFSVGFSYWNKSTTFVFTDNVTATDNLEFLIKWFQLFPQYSQNPFFISGESYAGHYIPTLVYLIAQLPPTSPPVSNFKGFLVGNPSTDVHMPNGSKFRFDNFVFYLLNYKLFRSILTKLSRFFFIIKRMVLSH
jgi:hypothetical protein